MKLLSISLALLLLHLQVFYLVFHFLYDKLYLAFIDSYILQLIIAIALTYFLIYRRKELKNISLNNFTKVFLFIGSSLFIVMVFINLFTLEVPHYFTNLFSIAKGFILIGLLSLVLENILPKDNHIKLYQKIIFFVALVIFYS